MLRDVKAEIMFSTVFYGCKGVSLFFLEWTICMNDGLFTAMAMLVSIRRFSR